MKTRSKLAVLCLALWVPGIAYSYSSIDLPSLINLTSPQTQQKFFLNQASAEKFLQMGGNVDLAKTLLNTDFITNSNDLFVLLDKAKREKVDSTFIDKVVSLSEVRHTDGTRFFRKKDRNLVGVFLSYGGTTEDVAQTVKLLDRSHLQWTPPTVFYMMLPQGQFGETRLDDLEKLISLHHPATVRLIDYFVISGKNKPRNLQDLGLEITANIPENEPKLRVFLHHIHSVENLENYISVVENSKNPSFQLNSQANGLKDLFQEFYNLDTDLSAFPSPPQLTKLINARDSQGQYRFTPTSLAFFLRDKLTLTELEQIDVVSNAKPNALILLPKSDYNGAFAGFGSRMVEFLKSSYNITYRTVGTVSEFCEEMKNAPSLDVLVIGGHGNPTSLALGDADSNGDNTLRVSDPRLNACFSKVNHRATIILQSCSTGGHSESGQNFANFLLNISGAKEIYAPSEPDIYLNAETLFPIKVSYRNENDTDITVHIVRADSKSKNGNRK